MLQLTLSPELGQEMYNYPDEFRIAFEGGKVYSYFGDRRIETPVSSIPERFQYLFMNVNMFVKKWKITKFNDEFRLILYP